MGAKPLLDRLADRYRGQGYSVTMNPGPNVLPPFAKDFEIELLAERSDGNVLVSAKADRSEFERDARLADYADVIGKHRGWRYDVTLLKPPSPRPSPKSAEDSTEEQIKTRFDEAKRLFESSFEPQALLTAWAAFEASMRHRMRAKGQKAEYGASPRSMLNELLSSGEIDYSEFSDIQGLMELRNVVVHGFTPPEIAPGAIEFLISTGVRLLEDTEVDETD